MDQLHYNMRFGYIDALCRANFTEFLTEGDYLQLKQSETLDDLRLHLGNAGFQDFLSNDAGEANPNIIYERCMERMVVKFNGLLVQSYDELHEFFVWIKIPFMIDNIVLLISGINRHRDLGELIERCHPLGMFDGIKALSVCNSVEDLYNMVLIDTPLGPLFKKCLSTTALDEQKAEIIRLMLYRQYFEEFYEFCVKLGGETATQMKEILEFEADRRAIIITLNSLRAPILIDDKETLYPRIGKLYPEATHQLVRAQSESDVA